MFFSLSTLVPGNSATYRSSTTLHGITASPVAHISRKNSMAEEKNASILSSDESLPDDKLGVYLRNTIQDLLNNCSKLCSKIAPMLVGGSTIEHEPGAVWRASMNVLEQRLSFWRETIFDHKGPVRSLRFDPQLTISTLTQLVGVLHGLHQSPAKRSEEHIVLVDSLYTQLPDIWRDSTEWALTASLMKTAANFKTKISEEFESDNLFLASLGSSRVEKNFKMMLELTNGTTKPSSLPLLTPEDLVPPDYSDGSHDGIEIYSQISDKDKTSSGRLISVRTEWTIDQATEDSEDMEKVKEGYRKRLQLQKPDEMRVLALAGCFKNHTTGRVELMYHFPHWASQDSAPVSLHQLIAEKQLPNDIKVRSSIARKLVCAILYFHSCRWAHGNIDDRNIIFFKDSEHNLNFEEPFFSKFIPSFSNELGGVPQTKSVDAIFGNDVRRINADTNDLWRIVLLVIFDRDTVATVATKNSRDSSVKCLGANLELSRWAEIEQYVSDLSKGDDMGSLGSEGISRQGLYWNVISILNHALSRFTEPIQHDHILQGSYKGTWSEIPSLNLESPKKVRSMGVVGFEGEMKESVTQNTNESNLSDESINLLNKPENEDTRDGDPTPSIEKQIFPVNATPAQLTAWRKNILPRLERILEKHLRESTESISIDLLGIGTSQGESRPTIVVTCTSTQSVKRLLKRFNYDRSSFSLKVRKGSVKRFCDGAIINKDSKHQKRPLPGASIGACLDGKHLPAATYGGLVLVDGEPYGLTVHHILDLEDSTQDQSIMRSSRRFSGDDDDCQTTCSDRISMGDYDDCHVAVGERTALEEDPVAVVSRLRTMASSHQHPESDGENSESEVEYDDDSIRSQGSTCGSLDSDEYELLNNTDIDVLPRTNEVDMDYIGDIPGLGKDHGKDIVVIQPADQDLLGDERSNFESDIVGQYGLGTIHASSGIRRITLDSEKHEVDWALIKISPGRLGQRNIIRGSGSILKTPGSDSEPCSVVSMKDIGNLEVHGIGRTSGLRGGVINGAISSIKFDGRETASKSWFVIGKIGDPGDSGAWVVDNNSGRVCGHIFAGITYPEGQILAYINPMELLLQDIKEKLQADNVCLPTAAVAAEFGSMVESRLLGSESSFVDIRSVSSSLSTGGSDEVHSLASLM